MNPNNYPDLSDIPKKPMTPSQPASAQPFRNANKPFDNQLRHTVSQGAYKAGVAPYRPPNWEGYRGYNGRGRQFGNTSESDQVMTSCQVCLSICTIMTCCSICFQ